MNVNRISADIFYKYSADICPIRPIRVQKVNIKIIAILRGIA